LSSQKPLGVEEFRKPVYDRRESREKAFYPVTGGESPYIRDGEAVKQAGR